jgi:hypothetical protein
MSNKSTKDQEDQLKKLKEKQLPADVQKSIDEKLKYINKPIKK